MSSSPQPEGEVETLTAEDLCRFEMGLTVATCFTRGDFRCAQYFQDRGDAIIPHIVKRAMELGHEPDEVFHTYAQAVHEKLCKASQEILDEAQTASGESAPGVT